MIYTTDTIEEQLFIAKITADLGAQLADELTARANANLADEQAQHDATYAAQLVADLREAIRTAEAA